MLEVTTNHGGNRRPTRSRGIDRQEVVREEVAAGVDRLELKSVMTEQPALGSLTGAHTAAGKLPIGARPIDPQRMRETPVAWQARWLQDPIFAGVAPVEKIHPHRCAENNGRIQNIHTLFRREFLLPARRISTAHLYLTADDTYRLYLNGQFVGLGPAPSFPFDYFYNGYDVTGFLREGRPNVIGAHVFYQGLHNLAHVSADNLQGLLVQLEIRFADGAPLRIVSDGSWRCCRTAAYEARQIYGYQTAFSEHIDLRRWPAGWESPGFDDRDWSAPLVGDIPKIYSLSPQPTPPVAVCRTAPVRLVKRGAGHYFIDFGCELAGEVAFRVTGAPGQVVEIRHGEETDGPDSVRYQMRCNCNYQEFCTLSGRPAELLTFFDYKGFRYVEVLGWPEELRPENVWAHERHYPFPDGAARFQSSNPLLNDIWHMCRNGVRVGTVDTYLDCPTREKGGFVGDAFVTGISHLILTGDARILRKFLNDVANTGRYCPGLFSTAPNRVSGEIADYSLLWPVLLEYYYQWTDDRALVGKLLPVVRGLVDYYAGYENDDGLLQDVVGRVGGGYSVLVDWPANLRDDYDDPCLMGNRRTEASPRGVVNTQLQGHYYAMLRAACRLADLAGDGGFARQLRARADRLQQAALRRLRCPETGLFVDRPGSTHSSLHANVMPLVSGLVPPDQRAPLLAQVKRKRLSCGVYFSWFVLKALYDNGEGTLAYELMTSQDRHSWHSMLQAGATTCLEAWAPDLKWNTSWCHPWSSAPIGMIAHELIGLRPGAPGWKSIRFAPQMPEDLQAAALTLTTPRGVVEAAFRRATDTITYQLVVPTGCTATCRFPGRHAMIRVNGTERAGVVDGRDTTLAEPLGDGRHTVVVWAACERDP